MEISRRRDFLKFAGVGVAGTLTAASPTAFGALSHPECRADSTGQHTFGILDVKSFGATGSGTAIDSPAVNKAIDQAASHGGGTVYFGPGQYLCYSIRLRSNVALYLDQGAVIIAADPLPEGQAGGYDDPEPPQPWEAYQDFGHNHWQNSLIWGVNLHDISILGPGRIWGRGLVRSNSPTSNNPKNRRVNGVGNKSIALKNCHNVVLKDFQILKGGWFGILATGVDNLVIDGLTIDTNRDGMDIDCCRNVRISNCAVNSPWDDAIVPKSSYALGYRRATENLEISNCYVTGAYKVGAMLDGTWAKYPPSRRVPHTGRIKLGTESDGGFKNIAISNCVLEGCRGIALETVDGAILEDIAITNITMRDILMSPLFVRLGSRLRGPSATTHTGNLRRIVISNIACSNAASDLGCIISGVPGHEIEDIKLSNIFIQHQGGGTSQQSEIMPPENAPKYPEPNMFGPMPSQGFFLRHVKNIELSGIQIQAIMPDARPAFVLHNVEQADFFHIKTPTASPVFKLYESSDIKALWVRGVRDGQLS